MKLYAKKISETPTQIVYEIFRDENFSYPFIIFVREGKYYPAFLSAAWRPYGLGDKGCDSANDAILAIHVFIEAHEKDFKNMSKSFNIFRKASHDVNEVLKNYKVSDENKKSELLAQADKIVAEVRKKTKHMKFKTNLFGDKPYGIEDYLNDLNFLKNYLIEKIEQ